MGWVLGLGFRLLRKLLLVVFGSTYKPFLLINHNIMVVVIILIGASASTAILFFFLCRLIFFIILQKKPLQQESTATWKLDNNRDLELNKPLCRHSTCDNYKNQSISAVVDITPSFSTTKSCLLDHIQLENHTKDLVVSSSNNEASNSYETQSPPPPPPLKVIRKKKLEDRITTLHQLVCPFGKNNTAVVLLEAIGYIKFLQDQIHYLSIEQMKPAGALHHRHHCQKFENSNLEELNPDEEEEEEECPKHDLRSQGFCLVPLSTVNIEQIKLNL